MVKKQHGKDEANRLGSVGNAGARAEDVEPGAGEAPLC